MVKKWMKNKIKFTGCFDCKKLVWKKNVPEIFSQKSEKFPKIQYYGNFWKKLWKIGRHLASFLKKNLLAFLEVALCYWIFVRFSFLPPSFLDFLLEDLVVANVYCGRTIYAFKRDGVVFDSQVLICQKSRPLLIALINFTIMLTLTIFMNMLLLMILIMLTFILMLELMLWLRLCLRFYQCLCL